MNCPFCGYSESKVVDSRPTDEKKRRADKRICASKNTEDDIRRIRRIFWRKARKRT